MPDRALKPNALMDESLGEVPPEDGDLLEENTLIIEDETLRKGFTSVPNYVFEDTVLSIPARFTYICLLRYAWQAGSCFPGQIRLAKNLGVSDRMVRKYLQELVEREYIKVIRRGLGKTNVYVILKVKLSTVQPASAQSSTAERNCSSAQGRNTADRKQSSDQERNYSSAPKRNPSSDKEDSVEEDSVEKDSLSKFRKAPSAGQGGDAKLGQTTRSKTSIHHGPLVRSDAPYSENIAVIMQDFTRQVLHDMEHLQANITRAMNLWRESALTEQDFIDLLYEAKEMTLKRTAVIKKRSGEMGLKNRAPYFFEVLKDLMGKIEHLFPPFDMTHQAS